MTSGRLTRQIALLAGGLAIGGIGTLTACGGGKQAPSTPSTTTATTTSSSSAPAPSPTAKADPMQPGGPNSFTPTILAPPAPTAIPGQNNH